MTTLVTTIEAVFSTITEAVEGAIAEAAYLDLGVMNEIENQRTKQAPIQKTASIPGEIRVLKRERNRMVADASRLGIRTIF